MAEALRAETRYELNHLTPRIGTEVLGINLAESDPAPMVIRCPWRYAIRLRECC